MATLSATQIAALARKAGFTGADIPIAVAVAFAESGGNPNSVNRANRNGSVDYGLMQINSVHSALLRTGNWADPATNMRMAYRVFADAGKRWTPWATFNSGSYKKFLAKGTLATSVTKPFSVTPSKSKPATDAASTGGGGGDGGDTAEPATTADTVESSFYLDNLSAFTMALAGGLLVLFALYQMTGSDFLGNAVKLAVTKGKA